MTKFRKIAAIAGTVALITAIGVALHEVTQARDARAEAQKLRAEQASLARDLANLQAELSNLTNQSAGQLAENSRLRNNPNDRELLKLRSEVTRLRPLQDDVVALQKMLNQSAAGLAQWKTNELTDAGRATPIDALRTYLYSSQITNAANIRNGIVGDDVDAPTPEALQDFIKSEIDHPGTELDMDVTGYKILSQTWLASDKVRVELQLLTTGGVGISGPFTLRKVDGEWKLVAFNTRNSEGKIGKLEFINENPSQ